MDARIKAVLTEIQEICRANDCDGACPFAGVGSKRCAFGIDPVDWEFNIFTKPERDLLRLTGAKFISRDEVTDAGEPDKVYLWENCPREDEDGTFSSSGGPVGQLTAALFPSIPSCICLNVTALLGEGEADHGQ